MINIIVPIVENVDGFKTFIKAHLNEDVKFFVGIRQSVNAEFDKGVEVHVFKNSANKEEIINSLHSCKMQKGKIMVVRRPLTDEEFKNLATSTAQITTLKAKRNKFVSMFKRMARAIVKKIFAFSFFEDISAISYSEDMFELLSVCNNFSMATRLNKYVGVEIQEIETSQKPVRKQYNRFKNALLLACWSLILACSIAGGTLVCVFFPLHVLNVVCVIFWIFTALVIWLGELLNFTRTVAVGNLRYGRAEEV